MAAATEIRRSDYSLVGRDAALAVERGLANAPWYTPHVPREKMRELLERRDGPAIRDTVLWFVLLGAFGIAGYLLWGTGWAIIPFAVYGVLYASASDSRWHETSHGTAFKTDWLNNVIYEIASFMVLRESVPWRWSHTRHHSDTIIVGRDAEIAFPRPINIPMTLLKFVNGEYWIRYWQRVLLHCAGKMSPEEITYIPESEYGKVILRARIYTVIYAAVIGLALYSGSILPLMFIGLPNIYGVWLMVVYGGTQHAGLAENVLDHRLNTRTVYMNAIHRYLYWNMGYHTEHHIFPMVPYHALPKLHEAIKSQLPPPYNGLIEAWREIIPALWRQSKDPTYFVDREPLLPTPAWTLEDALASRAAGGAQIQVSSEGWVEVCPAERLGKGEVMRFDYNNHVFAIYRTVDNEVYATDGLCTHARAPLTDGLLIGTLIECPKHNGRFDIRDGSCQRRPVRVPLRTYAVRESEGRIWLDVSPVQDEQEKPSSGEKAQAPTVENQVTEPAHERLS
jgi:Na+-transporting NADH:ubiquinone oxidoreductase subunit F